MKVNPSRMQPEPHHYSSSSVQGAEFTHMPDNITVLEGDSVTLRCQIDEEVTHKAWLNRSNIMFTGRDKWTLDKRVTLLNNNSSDFSIHISKVQVTDEGPYTCTFQANNKPRLTHVYLIVQVPARIVNISKDVSVNEGENVNLFCLAVGRPEPTVTWKVHKYRGAHAMQFRRSFSLCDRNRWVQACDHGRCIGEGGGGRVEMGIAVWRSPKNSKDLQAICSITHTQHGNRS
ncbi:hypothetical protein NQD34_011790 [Periophthalmus magnuspinnatus]|nr:hypothetical protein NQD34_011790 [Periophthalmus magnuspinnatus]